MSHNPPQATAFIALISAAGLCSIGYGLTLAASWHPLEALTLFAIAVVAARMKVKLPGLTGTMSVNLPFVLIAVAELNLAEALLVACASTAAQCWPKAGAKPKPVQMLFNVSLMAFAVAAGWRVFHQGAGGHPAWLTGALLVPSAVLGFFLIQTVPVSIVIALTDGGQIRKIWANIAQMTFPYFVLNAGTASMLIAARQHTGSPVSLLLLPVMYGTYRSYQMYFGREAADNSSLSLAKAASAGD